ncbi:hypothetical protein F4859DRAFT_124605 [Xylaria cf. heliscus]|nr:hypothetical protein F4859DRAFT_124605 [Xylaria cf. heliscus]
MERSRQYSLLAGIAKDLEVLPFELIQPILKELPFLRTLDLLVLSNAGNHLREAIRYGPRWVHFLGDETDEIEYLWSSLEQLASIQYGRPWAQVMGYKFNLWRAGLTHVANPTNRTTKVWTNTVYYTRLRDY